MSSSLKLALKRCEIKWATALLARAFQKGKSGFDFRTGLPFWIGNCGGQTLVHWPNAGGTMSFPLSTRLASDLVRLFGCHPRTADTVAMEVASRLGQRFRSHRGHIEVVE